MVRVGSEGEGRAVGKGSETVGRTKVSGGINAFSLDLTFILKVPKTSIVAIYVKVVNTTRAHALLIAQVCNTYFHVVSCDVLRQFVKYPQATNCSSSS